MENEKLKIGDNLYRSVPPYLMKYVVKGIRKYEEDEQYEVECMSCKHGWQCSLLVCRNDYGKFAFVKMLNNDEDDDQRCWHTEPSHFWRTINEASKERLHQCIIRQRETVKRQKEVLASSERHLKELEDSLELIEQPNEGTE